jgi:hypothetical protein
MDIKKICEAVKRKRVIRGGKIKRKWSTDRVGYKVVIDPRTKRGKEVRMKPDEVRKRLIASRRRNMKLAAMRSRINRKREISMKKRKGW